MFMTGKSLIGATSSTTSTPRTDDVAVPYNALHWYNHMWLAIVGQNWDAYRADHLEHSSNALAGGVAGIDLHKDDTASTHATTTDGSDSENELALHQAHSRQHSEIGESAAPAGESSLSQYEVQEKTRSEVRERLLNHFHGELEAAAGGTATLPPAHRPVMQLLLGFVHEAQGNTDEAILCYSDANLADHRRVMSCLVQSFAAQVASDKEEGVAFNPLKFIAWALDINLVLGLQAYRLVIEVLYRELLVKLGVDNFNMDKFLALGSFRTYPGSHWNAAKKDANGVLTRSGGTTNGATDFTWVENEVKSEALNESVTCIMLNANVSLHVIRIHFVFFLNMLFFCSSDIAM